MIICKTKKFQNEPRYAILEKCVMIVAMKIIEKNAEEKSFCSYYTGAVERSKVWVLVSALRGTEHICFDRTVNKEESVFEFFVPHDTESIFLKVMKSGDLKNPKLLKGKIS